MSKRTRKDQLYNDPSYDVRTDELLLEIYQKVKELSQLISDSEYSGVSLVSGVLYLLHNGGWEVKTGEHGTKVISPLTDIELVLGYYFAPPDDQEPESYFFRMTPDIKRTQVCQIFLAILNNLDEKTFLIE